MRKITSISALILFSGALIFTSCSKKKDWNCTCTVAGVQLPSVPILDKKKSDAEAACETSNQGGAECVLTEQ